MVIPGVVSDPKHKCAGVPQGFVLSPPLFLIYINDIVEEIESNINLFADDTCLSMVVGNPNAAGTILQNNINKKTHCLTRPLLNYQHIYQRCYRI